MNRAQLEHVLRAAADITREHSFVVIGSQAVLLSHPNAPDDLLVSREVDLYPALAPDKADMIEGAIGVLSQFDETFGYYADGVGPDTAKMPSDWMQFAQLHYLGQLTVIVPELHDLAVSKCVAGRDKDAHWVAALLRHKMIELSRFVERLRALDPNLYDIARLTAWAQRRADEATP